MLSKGTNRAPKLIAPRHPSAETMLSKVTWDFHVPKPRSHFLILDQSCFGAGTKKRSWYLQQKGI